MLEALPNPIWAYLLVGLICGIFSATFGVGSGIILIPALVLIFALPQKSAQGVCLAVMVPMAAVGAWRYLANPDVEVNLGLVAVLSVGAVVGAVIGCSIAGATSGLLLRRLFAVVMIVVAVKMLIARPQAQAAPPGDGNVAGAVDATEPGGGAAGGTDS